MSAHLISNPVPTPEQMADLLGVSRKRVDALRGILSAPSPRDQIVALTRDIRETVTLFKRDRRAPKSSRGLLLLQNKRRHLLEVVRRADPALYKELMSEITPDR